MKEIIKLSLQEELERETEELKKEIEQHPELADIKVSEEMDAAFFERARALEKALKEEKMQEERLKEERLREETEFSEELMPDVEWLRARTAENTKIPFTDKNTAYKDTADKETTDENTTGEKKKPAVRRRRRWRRRLLVALAAALVLMMGLSMTVVGSKSYFKVWAERVIGDGEGVMRILNVEDMDVLPSEDSDLATAYAQAESKLGIYVVRLIYVPEKMYLDNVEMDETLMQAKFFYKYDDEVITYSVYQNYHDSSKGQKEDKAAEEYNLVVKDVEIKVKAYKVKNKDEYRRVAEFVYQDGYYWLDGIMEKDEFDKILKNLYFF